MNFHPADINAAVRRGIGPGDPRFVKSLEDNRQRRLDSQNDMRVRGVLHGASLLETYRSASEWLHANTGTHAPIWLGHDPETTIHERGAKKFIHFAAKGTHQATIFEICGKTFRRIL